MKVLITEEQLKLIINEQNDDVKLTKGEKNILQNYIPIPKEQIAAYEQLKQYAESKGIKVKQLPELKNYPFNNKHMKKLLDKGVVFSQNVKPYDYHELVSGVISHNHAINKNADGKWAGVAGGKKKFLDTPNSYEFKGNRLKNSLSNDLEIEELLNLKKLIDVASDLKNMGVPVDTITAGDDMFHRSSTKSNHQRSHAIDFTITKSNDDIQKHMEEAIAVLISRDPDLAENLTFSNEYYYPAGNATGGHIHMAYGHPDMAQFRWLTDINGNQLRKGSNKKINKKIVDNPKYSDFYKDVETDELDPITTTVPPLGDVKIKGNNLNVNMGNEASQLGFQLFKKVGNKEEEIPYKKTNGNETVGGQTTETYKANESKFFSLPSFMSSSMMRTLPGTLLFVKVSRVMNNLIVPNTTKQTEDFTIDFQGNILTGNSEIDNFYKINKNVDPKYTEEYLDIEQDRIMRGIDNTYVKPNTIPIDLPKIEFKKD